MKQDNREKDEEVKLVEIGTPDLSDLWGDISTFVITPELAAQLEKYVGQSFLVGGNGYATYEDWLLEQEKEHL